MTSRGGDLVRRAIGDLLAGHQHHQPLRSSSPRATARSGYGDAALVELDQQVDDIGDFGCDRPPWLVGDQQFGISRHGTGEPGAFRPGSVAGRLFALAEMTDQKLVTAAFGLFAGEMTAAP
jgi:hypothetical protein